MLHRNIEYLFVLYVCAGVDLRRFRFGVDLKPFGFILLKQGWVNYLVKELKITCRLNWWLWSLMKDVTLEILLQPFNT